MNRVIRLPSSISTEATITGSTEHHRTPTTRLALDTGVVEVESEGIGPDFVLIHSLLTGPEAYDRVAGSLSEHLTVHRVFLPGFGGSTPLAISQASIADLADVVASTMAAIGCGVDTTVFGNGLGAFVALSLAIHHGHTFEKLIASNVGATFPTERKQAFITMSELADTGGMASVADIAVKRIFPEGFIAAHPTALDDRRAVLEQVDPSAFAAACRALAALDLRGGLSSVANTALVIAGEIDQTTPPEMAQEVVELVQGSRLAIIPDCGHCPQLEQPAALLATVDSFLST